MIISISLLFFRSIAVFVLCTCIVVLTASQLSLSKLRLSLSGGTVDVDEHLKTLKRICAAYNLNDAGCSCLSHHHDTIANDACLGTIFFTIDQRLESDSEVIYSLMVALLFVLALSLLGDFVILLGSISSQTIVNNDRNDSEVHFVIS